MKQTVASVLKEVLENVNPSSENVDLIESSLKEFLARLEKSLKRLKINAEIFVGGSYAKKTMIRKNNYDIDIFLRFIDTQVGHTQRAQDKNLQAGNNNISGLTAKALKGFNAKVVHGSRDYFQVTITKDIFFEIIPVVKVTKPKDAKNITDLSYSHVNYIKRKVKSQKILDDMKLAKVFCYANNCYGAESYIHGFSGYALELLVYHYGGFLKFVREMAKATDKIIVDTEKHYRTKIQVMMDVNTSKLKSPIILIDPTYKQRNAAAALSEETFEKFQKVCRAFFKNPSAKFFKSQEIDFEKIKANANKQGFEFIELEIKTNRQAGDIAGSKLFKFNKHLGGEMERFFVIKNQGFDYTDGKIAKSFFVVKSRGEVLYDGPPITDIKNVKKFKKEHPKAFIKNHRVYARKKIRIDAREFLGKWKVKNNKRIKEMGIVGLKVI